MRTSFRACVVACIAFCFGGLVPTTYHAQSPPTGATDASVYCCDAGDEPGQADTQLCAEGYACCAGGAWSCNDAAGAATCAECAPLCCDSLAEPGQFGNAPCIEGASCCSTGDWQCNDATGSSTCEFDGVTCDDYCDPRDEPGANGTAPCVEGATCCSTGEWQCNDAWAHSTCEVNGRVCEAGEPNCCDPTRRPNETGNAFCATGFVCCADGTWQCNDPTGEATCAETGDECPEVCGGIAGIPCSATSDFCKLPTGECCCDALGTCTEIPTACPEYYDPVCGCDGATYDNECFADAAEASIEHTGPCGQVCGGIAGIPCEDGEFCLLSEGGCCCDYEGVCVTLPDDCPALCDPVCGCDGQTYNNACMATMHAASVQHPGPCFEGGGLITDVLFEADDKMTWAPQNGALFYNVYRNVVIDEPPFGSGVCFATELPDPSVEVPDGPGHPGVLWLFQVTGQYPDGEGKLGINWVCEERTPSEPCSPSEQSLCVATGGTWDPLSCGHYPCGQFPDCDAIIPGCDCGIGNNYFPGVGCQEDPACEGS